MECTAELHLCSEQYLDFLKEPSHSQDIFLPQVMDVLEKQ